MPARSPAIAFLLHAAAAAAFVAAPRPAGAASRVLPVTEVIQEQDQWCWAGTTRCALLYFGVDQAQCSIAEYTRTVSNAPGVNLGPVDCCVASDQGCNSWNFFWYYSGSIADILVHFGASRSVQVTTYQAPLTLAEATSAVDAGNLFMLRWEWPDATGHFLLGHGYDGTLIHYMNPWPGEGLKIGEHSWLKSGDTHSWTTSITISGTVPSPCEGQPDGTRCDDGDPCTLSDQCTQGTCAGVDKVCAAPDDCHSAACVQGWCTTTALPDGTACSQGYCLSGECVVASCTGQPEGMACDDGDPCTVTDRCTAGACRGTDKQCTAPNPCHTASCNPLSGACVFTQLPNGTACPDGTCSAGTCTNKLPLPDDTGCSAAGPGHAGAPAIFCALLAALRRRRPRHPATPAAAAR